MTKNNIWTRMFYVFIIISMILSDANFYGIARAAQDTKTSNFVDEADYVSISTPGRLSNEQIKDVKQYYSADMLLAASYYYPELNSLLDTDLLMKSLSVEKNELVSLIKSFSQSEKDIILGLTPIVLEAYNFEIDPISSSKNRPIHSEAIILPESVTDAVYTEVIEDVYGNSDSHEDSKDKGDDYDVNDNQKPSVTDSVYSGFREFSLPTLFNFNDRNTLYHYERSVDTEADVNAVYRSASQADTDIYLEGKHGLDLSIIRMYDSMNAKTTLPSYESTQICDQSNSDYNTKVPASDCMGNTVSQAIDSVNDTDYFVSTGWTLNIPTMKTDWIFETIPLIFQPNSSYDVYNREYGFDQGRRRFTLEDGTTYEFDINDENNDKSYPINYPYHNVIYKMDSVGNHLLTLNDQIEYAFNEEGEILYKKNFLDDKITYAYSEDGITITDSLNSVVKISRVEQRIIGITVTNTKGELLYDLSYDSDLVDHQATLRLVDKESVEPDTYTIQTIPASYYQLNSVRDNINKRTIKSYSYYEPDSSRHADFNFEDDYMYYFDQNYEPILDVNGAEAASIFNRDRSTYGEIEYLLLKQINEEDGLSTNYQYSTYDGSWDQADNWKDQVKKRGSNRVFLDSNIITYVGYHPVLNVYYSYTDNHNNQKIFQKNTSSDSKDSHEIWNISREEEGVAYVRLSDSTSRSGDQIATKYGYNYGDYVINEWKYYTPHSNGKVLNTYSYTDYQDMNSPLQQNIDGVQVDFGKSVVMASFFENGYDPSIIKTFTDNLASDNRTEQLKRELYFGGNASNITNQAAVQSYSYDNYGFPKRTVDVSGNVTNYLYNGPFHQVSYIENVSTDSSLIKRQSYAYNSDGTVGNHTVINSYSNEGKPSTDTLVTDYLSYNSNKQPTHIRVTSSGDLYGNYRAYEQYLEYDANGLNVTKQTVYLTLKDGSSPTPISYTFQYDKYGRQILSSFPDGSQVQSKYDFNDRVISEKYITTTSEPALDYSYEYNDKERKITETSPEGIQTITNYTPYGDIEIQSAISGNNDRILVENSFNKTGLLQTATKPYGNDDMKTTFAYAGNGELSQTTDALGYITRYFYANTAVSGSKQLPQSTVMVTNPEGKTEITKQNLSGQTDYYLEKSLTSKRETYNVFNSLGQNIKTSIQTGDQKEVTEYTYNPDGNLISMIDAEKQKYTYYYDFNGSLTRSYINGVLQKEDFYNEVGWLLKSKKTQLSDTPELKDTIRTTNYIYNNIGLVSNVTDQLGQSYSYEYNGYNQEKNITVKNAQNENVYQIEKSYEPFSLLLKKISSSSDNTEIEYSYDDWNRLKSQTVGNHNYKLTYDAFDRMTGLYYPDGNHVDYTYDLLGRISSVSYPGMETATMDYSIGEDNQTTITRYPNQISQTLTANSFNETVSNQFSGMNEKIEYDGYSNVNKKTVNSDSFVYAYDGLNRLKQEINQLGSRDYSYDEQGNINAIKGDDFNEFQTGSASLEYDALNQLSSYISVDNDGVEKKTAYTYYGDGTRATKTSNTSDVTRYVYLNGQVIEELDTSGNSKARNIWGGQNLLFRENHNSSAGYYYYNSHGDVIEIKDKAGKTLNTYEYDTWGKIVKETGNFNNPYKYAGEIYDDESGYYYLSSRYYDPNSMRFINEDTYQGDLVEPSTLNLYTYVGNNPLIYVDPSGHVWEWVGTRWRSIKKGASATVNFLVLDDIRTLTDPKSSFFDKSMAVAGFIPVGKVLKGGKLVVKWVNKNGKIINKVVKPISKCNCFTAGTKVQTADGEKPIEEIEIGDRVLSKDETTGEIAIKEVTATFNHETDEIYQIHVGDQVVESTYNHPFWVKGKGWRYVKDLKVGDLLVQSDGNILKIQSIELEHRHVTVYNMTVDEFHTYFVSDLGIWVHNTNCALFGAKGVQTTSKTIWKENGSKARIDVENPNPGQRPGQIHYQDANNKKYLFDPQKGAFVDSNGKLAPKSVNKMLKDSNFVKKLNVGLTQYLGESPYAP